MAMADILLLGMGPTARSALDSLAAKLNVLGLVRDRDSECQSVDPVVDRAQELGIPVFSDISLAAVAALISQLKPDCVVVSSYNRLLSPKLTAQCPFVNVHYAPLPRYRGRANVNWALINGESWAAVTIHTIVPELDAGNILFQQCIPIQDTDTVADLYEKLNNIQHDHLGGTVVRFLHGYEGIPQDNREATYGCSRLPEDGEIDWTASTRKICYLVRALVKPYPGAYTYFRGKRLMVWNATPVGNPPYYAGRIPGRVIRTSRTDGYVDVLTGDGILRIFEVQFQGENRTAAADVIKSVRETLGLRTVDLLERIQSLEQQVAKLMEISTGSPGYAE
jgi:methionyl-tRNA formyltransferase